MLLKRGILHWLDQTVVAFVGVEQNLKDYSRLSVWLLKEIIPCKRWIHVYEGLYELDILVFVLEKLHFLHCRQKKVEYIEALAYKVDAIVEIRIRWIQVVDIY